MSNWDKLYSDGVDTAPMNIVLFRDLFNKIEEISEIKLKTVLDLGGGTGKLSAKLAKKGLDVTVSDISSVALEKVRENANKSRVNTKTTQGDFEDKEFYSNIDEKYDLVIARFVIEFIKDRKLFIQNIKNYLLKPQGMLLLITPVRYKDIVYSQYSYPETEPLEKTVVDLFSEAFREYKVLQRNYRHEDICDLYILGIK